MSGADLEVRRAFEEWLKRLLLPSKRLEKKELSSLGLEEARTMLAERVREWTREWVEEGKKEGLEKGQEKGREEGLRKGVVRGGRAPS